ncbi:MAG TPA: hypothetical protein VGM23_07755 [Armatimonadota bacterium]
MEVCFSALTFECFLGNRFQIRAKAKTEGFTYIETFNNFFIVELKTRRIVHVGGTREPTQAWVAQQWRAATLYGQSSRFVIRDNDSGCVCTQTNLIKLSGGSISILYGVRSISYIRIRNSFTFAGFAIQEP